MFKQIIPAFALAMLALTGCSALESHTESERLNAQARADSASAALISAQAISATLSAQTAQTERLTTEVVRQSEASRLIALTLAGALAVLTVGGVVIVALALRRPTVTLTMPPVPDLPHLADRPEYRAMYRAMLAEAMQRDVERRRALIEARTDSINS